MKLGVIGAGAWGTALAQVAANSSKGEIVRLWALEPEVTAAVNQRHENPLYLPNISLSDRIVATSLLEDLADCDALLVVTPAQHLRTSIVRLPVRDVPLVLCSKGIEAGTMKLMSEVVADVMPDAPIAVLSGPTFAHEVAKGLPTAVTLACADLALQRRLAERLAQPTFRTYQSDDVTGAEIGGAVKNVLAIACGVVAGMQLGQNANAALISRGFVEMTRFGLARGARAETLSGLSGLGDLVLTCTSTASRNFSLGKGLGEGRSAQELMADRRTVAEGAFTAPVLQAAGRAINVPIPITDAVCGMLDGSLTARQAVDQLLARPIGSEL
ncbi:NAD(P)H-dependent glycerol-3-phosphate dehydrogenase [Aquisediminimonas sediminicola]|uniref:NAD(P)H-dependent glycerol-3-phosphate dehydrogenase n=1 Tax=Alteraquisediminimonas sediminicola TaxID=2676787 RepID=UPI001C8E3ECC|nr:NAD(P)H-dependent glycerol-3-phosphate dehydrogenase [Aquisediminimonas sediminicola]